MNGHGRTQIHRGALAWGVHRPLLIEAAVLIALAPSLMLGGYGALIVPAGVVVIWGAMHRWTGSAWPPNDLRWCIGALLVLTATSLVVSRGTLLWAVPKVSTLVFGIAWFFALIRWHHAGVTPQSLAWASVAACLSLSLVAAVGTNWMSKVWPLSAVTSRLPHASLGVGGLHPNAVAGTLILLIPMCIPALSQAWRGQKLLRVSVAGSALIFSLTILLLTQSRGGWLAALATTLTLLLYRVARMKAWPIVPIALSFGLGCAVVVFWGAVPGAVWAGVDLSEKWAARQEMWRLGVLIIGDFPWTGVGFNGFRHLAEILYTSAYDTYGMDIAHPHNMWLSVGADLGIPGVVTYGTLWMLAVRRLLRVAATGPQTEVLISQCLLAGWAGFWTFGIADAIPLGTKLGTALWLSFALSQMLSPGERRPRAT